MNNHIPQNKESGGGIIKFFKKLTKNEERHRNYLSTKSIKLPKNFANLVLDQELKIDSGQFNIDTINTLLQLYSVSFFLIFHILTFFF